MSFDEAFLRDAGILASAIVAVDNAYGGDIKYPSGTRRVIADCFRVPLNIPAIYNDPSATRIRQAARTGADADAPAKVLIEAERNGNGTHLPALYKVFDLSLNHSKLEEPWRAAYLLNMGNSLETLWNLRAEELGVGNIVSLEQAVEATHGFEPELIDVKPMLGEMATLLIEAGFDPDGHEGKTHLALDSWAKSRGIVPPDQIEATIRQYVDELKWKTNERVLPHLPKVEGPLGDVVLKGVSGVHFSASSTFLGEKPGRQTLFEFNTEMQRTPEELFLLSAHEFFPGHAFYNSLIASQMEAGRMGPEVSMGTMCTAESAFAEAHGDATIDLLYTPKEIEELPVHMKIARLRSELDGIAKHNTAILFYKKTPEEEIIIRNREEHLLSPEASIRYATRWTKSPSRAKGYMFSYAKPVQMFRKAIRERNRKDLIEVVHGVHGPVDIINFPGMVEKFCDKSAEA